MVLGQLCYLQRLDYLRERLSSSHPSSAASPPAAAALALTAAALARSGSAISAGTNGKPLDHRLGKCVLRDCERLSKLRHRWDWPPR